MLNTSVPNNVLCLKNKLLKTLKISDTPKEENKIDIEIYSKTAK